MEDKQHILDLLLPALQATRDLKDVSKLEYKKDCSEIVTVEYSSGKESDIVYVGGDSGVALINDVMRAITEY